MTDETKTRTCDICDEVLIDISFKEHMLLNHPAEMKQRFLTSKAKSAVSPSTREAPASTSRKKLIFNGTSTQKVAESRTVTVLLHPKKPPSGTNLVHKLPFSPFSSVMSCCPKCGLTMPEHTLKGHMREHDSRRHVEAPTDERSESIYAYSGGLPSLGKRAR